MIDQPKKKKKKKKKAKTAGASAADVAEVHPVAEVALLSLRKGDDDTLTLDDAGAANIGQALSGFFDQGADLVEAVQALLALAYYLEKRRGSGPAADALLKVAREAIPHLKALGVDVDEVLNKDNVEQSNAGAKFNKLVGEERYKADPRIDKGASVGGVLGLLGKKD